MHKVTAGASEALEAAIQSMVPKFYKLAILKSRVDKRDNVQRRKEFVRYASRCNRDLVRLAVDLLGMKPDGSQFTRPDVEVVRLTNVIKSGAVGIVLQGFGVSTDYDKFLESQPTEEVKE